MSRDAKLCPRCRQSELVYHTLARTGDEYPVCANYPDCGYVGDFEPERPKRRVPIRSA